MNQKTYTIGIIGGKGGMGSLFRSFFENAGHKVLIASRSTALSVTECASQSDIVIVTVPINTTIDVIKQVGPHIKKDALFMDFTSLKSAETEAMCKYSQSEVIGCHPVFGPSVKTLEKQVIVLTPVRGDNWLDFLVNIFENAGAIVRISSPKEHDRIMAIVQGLMHFTSITLVKTLMKTGEQAEEFNDFSSPVYRIRTDFANRILNQNPELYADIEINNPETVKILEQYIESSLELLTIIRRKDRDGFIREFVNASDYLGEYKKIAEEKTNKIIEYISGL